MIINMQKKWKDAGIHTIISPLYPLCAFESTDAPHMGALLDYSIIWNCMNYPGGTIPITTVQDGELDY